jgi:hypothetical protein
LATEASKHFPQGHFVPRISINAENFRELCAEIRLKSLPQKPPILLHFRALGVLT